MGTKHMKHTRRGENKLLVLTLLNSYGRISRSRLEFLYKILAMNKTKFLSMMKRYAREGLVRIVEREVIHKGKVGRPYVNYVYEITDMGRARIKYLEKKLLHKKLKNEQR